MNEKPLIIFEMANNHMGSLEHAQRIVRELAAIARDFPMLECAIKLQYRELDTFIHPDFAARMDLKFVKRFQETRLTEAQFAAIRETIRTEGLLAICTAFDEPSVEMIDRHGYDVIKIGSCSLADWPLMEKVVRYNRPIVASTAGAAFEEIDRVVAFFTHRGRSLTLMHCVAEYPTIDGSLQLNQIDRLRERYPLLRIGYSTHEAPDNFHAVQLAIAKGARVFEKHVGIPTEQWPINEYSADPPKIRRWLEAARDALLMCGTEVGRPVATARERETLRSLQRGVFAKRAITKGEKLSSENVFLALPVLEADQLVAQDLSKYTRWVAEADIAAKGAVRSTGLRRIDTREKVHEIERRVKLILRESQVVFPSQLELEISHHYGIDRFDEYGAAMLTLVNRGYCKKLIVVCPGQTHPEQWHETKEETFHVVWGDLQITLDGTLRECVPGDIVLVERSVKHRFSSRTGCVLEEFSTTHIGEDSFYVDPTIRDNKERKTYVTYWLDG